MNLEFTPNWYGVLSWSKKHLTGYRCTPVIDIERKRRTNMNTYIIKNQNNEIITKTEGIDETDAYNHFYNTIAKYSKETYLYGGLNKITVCNDTNKIIDTLTINEV